MTRVDFKQGVLQGGSGKLEKWVLCCQKSTGAGDIVLKRACSGFKRPHKTLTALSLFTLTPQSTKKYEIPGRKKHPAPFCPVLSLLSLKCDITSLFYIPHHALLRSDWRRKKLSIADFLVSFHHPECGASSHPLALTYCDFFFLLPTSKTWTGIAATFLDSSWRTPVFAWVLARSGSVWIPEGCVHGILSIDRANAFSPSHQISSSLSLQISHPFPHHRDW